MVLCCQHVEASWHGREDAQKNKDHQQRHLHLSFDTCPECIRLHSMFLQCVLYLLLEVAIVACCQSQRLEYHEEHQEYCSDLIRIYKR